MPSRVAGESGVGLLAYPDVLKGVERSKMQKPLFINAITTVDRYKMTQRVEQTVSACGGWIVNHHAFSNIALSLEFEMPKAKAGVLVAALAAAGLRLSDKTMADAQEIGSESETGSLMPDEELTGYISITFVHDEPDMRREIPAIPG